MPLIYHPTNLRKQYKVSYICHISKAKNLPNQHIIDVCTADYKHFIDEILQSEMVVSSSLHGIILAESYGVPALFWNDKMESELFKYYDWYFSTNRMCFNVAKTYEETLSMSPTPLPTNLEQLRKNLINSFPKDLWDG